MEKTEFARAVGTEREMRSHAVKLVRHTLQKKGIAPGAPWRVVVEKLGLPPVQFRSLLATEDGCCDGDQIIVNRRIIVDERIEFTVLHEVMHILIREDGRIDSFLLEY